MNEATILQMLAALRQAKCALHCMYCFRVGDTDSFSIASQVDAAIAAAEQPSFPLDSSGTRR